MSVAVSRSERGRVKKGLYHSIKNDNRPVSAGRLRRVCALDEEKQLGELHRVSPRGYLDRPRPGQTR
jgi:hypothetical protein